MLILLHDLPRSEALVDLQRGMGGLEVSSGWGKAPFAAPFLEVDEWPMEAAHNMIMDHVLAGDHAGKFYPGVQFSIVNNCDYQRPIVEKDPVNVAMANHLTGAWSCWFLRPIYITPDGKGGFAHDFPPA